LLTSHRRPNSEEFGLELPANSRAPKSTIVNQRETTPRLRECQPAATKSAPRPEGQDTSSTEASRPSWDPSTRRWAVSLVRRPPKHPVSERPSPRTFLHTPESRRRPEGRVSEGGEYVEALRTCRQASRPSGGPEGLSDEPSARLEVQRTHQHQTVAPPRRSEEQQGSARA
jgi:hypothetical protein